MLPHMPGNRRKFPGHLRWNFCKVGMYFLVSYMPLAYASTHINYVLRDARQLLRQDKQAVCQPQYCDAYRYATRFVSTPVRHTASKSLCSTRISAKRIAL